MKAPFQSLQKAHPKTLELLAKHQSLLLLLSISLIVGTFAQEELTIGLALGAFGTFFIALLLSLFMSTTSKEEELPSSGFYVFLLILYIALGLVFLGLAGASLLAGAGVYSNLPLVPYAIFLSIAFEIIVWLEYKRTLHPKKRTRGILFYRYVSLILMILIIFIVPLAISSFFLEESNRELLKPIQEPLVMITFFLIIIWFFTRANISIED